MEIQGVKILRISDLRRFFDLVEFWKQRKVFVKMVGDPSKSVFFDNTLEKEIYCILREWIINDVEIPLSFQSEDKILIRIAAQDTVLSLGRLAPEVSKYRGNIRTKDLIGLTLLYMLLNADKVNSDIPLQYDLFVALKTGNIVGNFYPCDINKVFEPSFIPQFPICRRIIANTSKSNSIYVCSGNQRMNLRPGDCVVGLFDANGCIRLLSNFLSDDQYGISMKMKLRKQSEIPYLEIHTHDGVQLVEEVSSIAIEKGGYPVYTTMDGELHCSADCFTLGNEYNAFCDNNKDNSLLAFEISPEGGYVFYTPNSILH